MIRRIFSMILAAVMVFTSVDITAFAQENSGAEVITVAEDESVTEEEGEGESGREDSSSELTAESTAEPTESPAATEEPTIEPTQEPTVEPTETPEASEIPAATETPTETPQATEEPTTEPTAEPTAAPTIEPTPEVEIVDFQVTANTTLTEDTKVTGDLYIKKGYDLFLGGYTLEIAGNAEIYGDIDLDGGSLVIDGNVLHTYGAITFDGGSVTIGGDYHLEEQAKDGTYNKGSGLLKMENSTDTLDVDGDFYGNSATHNLSAGTISFAGDVTILTQFKCTGTHKMIFDGTGEQRICFGVNNDQIYANELDIQNDKVVVERLSFAKLVSDVTISADDADIWAYNGNTALNLNGHSLTINGDVTLRGGGKGIELAGGTLAVNGNLIHPSGKLTFNGGKLEVSGDYRIEAREIDDLGQEVYTSSSGILIMNTPQDVLDVDGDFITNIFSATDCILTAGNIYLAGDVRIADGSVRGAETHRVVFDGTEEQIVNIANSNSYFNEIDIQNENIVLERIGFSKLVADAECRANDAVIWAGGTELSLDGHKLTVNGDVTIGIYAFFILDLAGGELIVNGDFLHTAGNLVFNKGKLVVNGNYRAATKVTTEGEITYDNSSTAIFMNFAEDYMDVNGDFASDSSRHSKHELNAGVMEIGGDIQIIDRYFRGKGTHKLVLDGTEEQTVFMDHTDSYFNEVEFKNENVVLERIGFSSFAGDSVCRTNNAVIWAGDPAPKSENNRKLTLNGHKWIVNGDITIGAAGHMDLDLAGGELTVNGNFLHSIGDLLFNQGSLLVSGDYRAAKKEAGTGDESVYTDSATTLVMKKDRDYMRVDGDFISDSSRGSNHVLSAGIIELAGDVTINDTYFKCSGTHKAILVGNEKQVITIPSKKAYFNILQLTKKMDNYEFNPYGCWKKLLKVKDILIKYADTYYYTGQAIKPEVEVYEGETLLVKDKDYTVSYKNNVKVNSDASGKKPPTIIVKGKGGYDGTNTATFKILKRNIGDEEITSDNFTATYTGTVQKKTPVLYHNGKKLIVKTVFTVSYPDLSAGAYKEPGTYTVLVKGKGSYTGTREVNFTITPVKFMKDVKVSAIASQSYKGEAITLQNMKNAPTIKYGTTVLTEGVHFTVDYEANVNIGTATMTLTGTGVETPEGTFMGTKTVTFKITGKSLSKAKVTGIPQAMTYTGQGINEQTEGWGKAIKVTLSGKALTRAADENAEGDYIVVYSKNVNKGTASVTIKGVNNYTGSVKKTFTINAYNINDNKGLNLVTEEMAPRIVFVKGGSKPEPVVKFGETVLTKGKDYTLSYANNTKYHNGTSKKKPTVTITGKGNFTGSVKLTFAIDKQDIGNAKLTAPDATYSKTKGAYKSALVVKDVNGKALKSGTDFTASYTYGQDVTTKNKKERKEGDAVNATDIVPSGTLLKVTVAGKGNYTSENPLTATYMVVKGSVANATVTVPSQKYTGEAIIIENTIEGKSKIKVKIGKEKLNPEDFEIVDDSFANNTNAGTASFMIKGVGDYGGIKKVTFTISKKKFDAWWRVIFR